MNSMQPGKLLTIGFCILLLIACKDINKEQPEVSASTSNNHPQSEIPLADNEVKAEAPDAKIKTEQGYAFPRHNTGDAQSPINIISDSTDKKNNQKLLFSFHSDINAAENLGHTVQIDFKEGSTCTMNGKSYASKQLHFHTPSEHLIDGITFPMEMHMVNVINDSASKPSYLVFAVLFKMGAENKFINEFLNKIPHEEGEKNTLQSGEVKLDDLLSQLTNHEIKSYYTYKGSLTTPPYTEAVQWVVLKQVVEASEAQIMAIEKMEGNNARHVQALNNRKIVSQ